MDEERERDLSVSVCHKLNLVSMASITLAPTALPLVHARS